MADLFAEIQTVSFIVTFLVAVIALAATIYGTFWLKERIEKSVDSLKEILFDDVTRSIFDKLKQNHRLAYRMKEVGVKEKKTLSNLLCEPDNDQEPKNVMSCLLNIIEKEGESSIFIESGSTLAYLCHSLCGSNYFGTTDHPLEVKTNNVLVNFLCVFKDEVSVQMLDGKPVGRYGASFGPGNPPDEPENFVKNWRSSRYGKSLQRIKKKFQSYNTDDYYLGSEDQYQTMACNVAKFLRSNTKVGLILMTSSKLSLIDGPHVGSFQNRDFKEIVFLAAANQNIPVVLILYDEKLHKGMMEASECLSVLGDEALKIEQTTAVDGLGTGMVRLARAIARGEVTLIVTNRKGANLAIGDERESNAGKLFELLSEKCTDLFVDGSSVVVKESSDNKVQIFMADCRRLSETNSSYSEFATELNDKLKKIKYNEMEVMQN